MSVTEVNSQIRITRVDTDTNKTAVYDTAYDSNQATDAVLNCLLRHGAASEPQIEEAESQRS